MPIASRMTKINELLSQELSQLLEEDSEELGMLSVVSVDTSRDLSVAQVFLATLTPAKTNLANQLDHRAKKYRSQLGKRLNLRRIPRFYFHLETQPEAYAHLESMLSQLDAEVKS